MEQPASTSRTDENQKASSSEADLAQVSLTSSYYSVTSHLNLLSANLLIHLSNVVEMSQLRSAPIIAKKDANFTLLLGLQGIVEVKSHFASKSHVVVPITNIYTTRIPTEDMHIRGAST